MSSSSREKVLLCAQKRGFGVFSMNKTGGRRKMLKTRANAAN
jgi:hypothetical protein